MGNKKNEESCDNGTHTIGINSNWAFEESHQCYAEGWDVETLLLNTFGKNMVENHKQPSPPQQKEKVSFLSHYLKWLNNNDDNNNSSNCRCRYQLLQQKQQYQEKLISDLKQQLSSLCMAFQM